MTVSESFKKFWSFVNQSTISPWVIAVLTAVGTFAYMEASVGAQGAQVEALRETVEIRTSEVKSDYHRDVDRLEKVLVERLDDIKTSQRTIEVRLDDVHKELDTLKDRQREIGSDLSIVCDKVLGRCRTR